MTDEQIVQELREHALYGDGWPVRIRSSTGYFTCCQYGWGVEGYDMTIEEARMFLLFIAESLE